MKRWLPVFLYALLIFVGSSIPGDAINPKFTLHDKIIHATEYAGLAFLLARAFGPRRWWLAILVGVLFGVSDEFHQTFVRGRHGSPVDVGIDAVGALIGLTVLRSKLNRWSTER